MARILWLIGTLTVVACLALSGCSSKKSGDGSGADGDDQPGRRTDNNPWTIVFRGSAGDDRVYADTVENGANWYWIDLKVIAGDIQWKLNGDASEGAVLHGGEQVRVASGSDPIAVGEYIEVCGFPDANAAYVYLYDHETGFSYSGGGYLGGGLAKC